MQQDASNVHRYNILIVTIIITTIITSIIITPAPSRLAPGPPCCGSATATAQSTPASESHTLGAHNSSSVHHHHHNRTLNQVINSSCLSSHAAILPLVHAQNVTKIKPATRMTYLPSPTQTRPSASPAAGGEKRLASTGPGLRQGVT